MRGNSFDVAAIQVNTDYLVRASDRMFVEK